MHKEIRRWLAQDYRYAVNKMQETSQPQRKIFYFSVFFSEAQRALNRKWDRDLVLIYAVTHYCHAHINNSLQAQMVVSTLPIDWPLIFDKLTSCSSDLATYFEKAENNDKKELFQILSRFTEIAYAVLGNGSYLFDKGVITL